MRPVDRFPRGGMRFLLGIEDTCVVPPPGAVMGPLDEHELTDHAAQWREDLDRVKELGADGLRYGVSWPKVHLAPGVFDWSELDERLPYAVRELGLVVVADLVHYGTPPWLAGAFADPGYPDAVAEFAGAFAARYRGLVDHVTPLNEPVTTASFCGLRGVWPPAFTSWSGWTAVVLGMVEGIRRTVAAVRAANPQAVIVHVEASSIVEASAPDLQAHADLLRAVARLPTDLLLGLVDDAHPMRGWLLEQGADPAALAGFRADVPVVDLLGLNYYPDLTPRRLERHGDRVEQRTVDRWVEGLRECVRTFVTSWGLPLLVTETSIEGDERIRARWATESAAALLRLRNEGVDVRGYTWWPLTDFVDWSWASEGRNVEEFLLEGEPGTSSAGQRFGDPADGRASFLRRMGLFSLVQAPDGSLERVRTAAADAFAASAGLVPEMARRAG